MGNRATRRRMGARLLLLALLAGVVVLALGVAAQGAFAFPTFTTSLTSGIGSCESCHGGAFPTGVHAISFHAGFINTCATCHPSGNVGTPPLPSACGNPTCHGAVSVILTSHEAPAPGPNQRCATTPGCHGATAGATITAITPASALAGASVTITGTGFGATAGTVMFGTTTATTTAWSATSITATVPASLAPGAVQVTVTPQGGTASAGFSFTVLAPGADTTPPVTTYSGVVNNGCYNHSLSIALSATDAGGVASISYSIDGGTATVVTGSSATVALDAAAVGDGVHVITFFATDVAGNVEATQTIRVKIDTVKPRTQASSAVRVHRYEFATLRYKVMDATPSCGKANVTIRIKSGAKVVKTLRVGVKSVNKALSVRVQAKFKPGTYRYYVYARDLAGNAQANVASNRLVILRAFGGGSW